MSGTLFLWFAGAAVVFVLLVVILGDRRSPVSQRLAGVTDGGHGVPVGGDAGVPVSAAAGMAVGDNPIDREAKHRLMKEERKQRLRDRMMHAGFYATAAGTLFLFFRVVLIAGSAGLGFLMSTVGGLTLVQGLAAGTVCGIAATVAPGMWLGRLKTARQVKIRRALPDALDVMVVCLQGGLSVMAAMSRVARELALAHPVLAVEIKIAERQMQMGRSAGDAVRGIADRFDLEELRGMSAVLRQAERIGSSVAGALEVFADTLRVKRQQRAEEMAQKAAVKMLFPTLLCIFPAIFVVILGPAGIQVYKQLITGVMRNL